MSYVANNFVYQFYVKSSELNKVYRKEEKSGNTVELIGFAADYKIRKVRANFYSNTAFLIMSKGST
jgi:hypothetical protein